jgi:hypothetical protein
MMHTWDVIALGKTTPDLFSARRSAMARSLSASIAAKQI